MPHHSLHYTHYIISYLHTSHILWYCRSCNVNHTTATSSMSSLPMHDHTFVVETSTESCYWYGGKSNKRAHSTDGCQCWQHWPQHCNLRLCYRWSL